MQFSIAPTLGTLRAPNAEVATNALLFEQGGAGWASTITLG